MEYLGSASPTDSHSDVAAPQTEYRRLLITNQALAPFEEGHTQQKSRLSITTVGRCTLTRGSDRELP